MTKQAGNSSSSSAKGSASSAPKEVTVSQVYKSYGGWPNYMASYGLKIWDHSDVETGREIAQEMADDANAQAKAANKK